MSDSLIALETLQSALVANDLNTITDKLLIVIQHCGNDSQYTDRVCQNILTVLDTLFDNGDFEQCDRFIEKVQPNNFELEIAFTVVTFTLAARSKLKNRQSFIERTEAYFHTKMDATRIERLFKNLR